MSDIKEKLTADEQAYLDKMKASLRELGVSLTSGVDIHEQARVINNRAFALAADGIYAKRAPYTDGVNPVDDPAQKLTAAQAYIAKMEEALLVFGLNPQNETIDLRDCARAYARGRADEQAMLDKAHEQRDAAQTRADTLRADLNGILSKLGISPIEGPEMRTKAILQICEESNTLGLIADHLGLSRLDPDAVRRRVQSDAVDLKVSRERVAKVEALLAEECVRGDNARHALSILGIIGDDLIGQAKSHAQRSTDRNENSARRAKELEAARSAAQTYASAEIKANNRAVKAEARVKELEAMLMTPAEGAHDYNAEVIAARIDALKTLGVNPYDPPVCVIGAAKKRAKTLELAQKFEDELAQIWELWGAGRPMTPGCVYEAAEEMERTATALRVKLGAIAEKLNDARIPTHYGRDQKGGPVPLPERVGLLIDSHESARMLAETWESSSMREAVERMDAAAVLSDLGAPSHAGAIHLTTAAQIRALPGLLRQE